MTVRRLTLKALAMLLPAGVLGISSVLAAAPSKASWAQPRDGGHTSSIADRLGEIRAGVSKISVGQPDANSSGAARIAGWPNFHVGFGWRNGGWGNGGWRNGGWGNGGWHNWGNGGWGNGGWGNGGGWHNWHNYWHNW
jgi:rSAM-associated Gly-rich repeat protein